MRSATFLKLSFMSLVASTLANVIPIHTNDPTSDGSAPTGGGIHGEAVYIRDDYDDSFPQADFHSRSAVSTTLPPLPSDGAAPIGGGIVGIGVAVYNYIRDAFPENDIRRDPGTTPPPVPSDFHSSGG